jgi:hypothetical protein
MNEGQFEYYHDKDNSKHFLSLRGRKIKEIPYKEQGLLPRNIFLDYVYNYIEQHSTGIDN